MNIETLLDSLGGRNTFSTIAHGLKQANLAVVSQGWFGTRAKLEALLRDSSSSAGVATTLGEIYKHNLLYTHKAVTLWSVDEAVATNLALALSSFVDPNSPYAATYPAPLPERALKATTAMCVPTAVEVEDSTFTLMVISKRVKTEEEVMGTDALSDALKDAGYTEVVGRRHHVYQVFDSVAIDLTRGLVEIRIDQAKGMSEKDVLKYRETIRQRFNQWARSILSIEEDVLGTPLNLVPALEPLYRGESWTVSRIGHINEGGYNNSNRGRHRTDDVRKDRYHGAGEEAVQQLQLWHVVAVFKSPGGHGLPRLELEGRSSMLSQLHPHMDIAWVLDCATRDDYSHLIGALVQCLKAAEAADALNAALESV